MTAPLKRKSLSPQERKALSLKKDRRASHGQNDKASRKLVPLRKAQANRKVRRLDKVALATLQDPEEAALDRPKGDWQKWPDAALGDHIAGQADKSLRREGRKQRTQAEWIDWYRRFYGDAVAERMKAVFATWPTYPPTGCKE